MGRDTHRDGDICKERQEGTRRERERFGRQKVKRDLSRAKDSERERSRDIKKTVLRTSLFFMFEFMERRLWSTLVAVAQKGFPRSWGTRIKSGTGR